jgi:hypothetical protein
LLKIAGRGAEAKVVARLPLKSQLGHSLALDESGETPVLWLGGSGKNAGPSNLVRVEDRGASFSPAGESILNPSKDDVSFVCYGDVDTEAELVYVTAGNGSVWRYNGETGEGGLFPVQSADLAVGPGGMVYAWAERGSFKGPVARYGRDGKPAPLAATGKHTYGAVYGRAGRGVNAPGIAVDNRGWVYATCGFNDCHVRVFDADGRLVDHERKGVISGNETLDGQGRGQAIPAIISYVLDMGGSLRVDHAYNLYVLEIGLPKGFVPPKGFEKDPRYTKAVGTIYKFTPKGGEFKKAERPPLEAVGAVQTYPGCGTISGGAGGGSCHCQRPRFGLDGYGRLYIPNGVTYKVSVRDNADNEIVNFGGYGNWDAQGPQSAEPRPEIPLGWPMFAGPSDRHIYVGDGLNHRVVRVDKRFAAEETCEVR